MVHPWRYDYLAKTAYDPGYAAKKEKSRKFGWWGERADQEMTKDTLTKLNSRLFGETIVTAATEM